MEFWGEEVKSGQPLDVSLAEGKVLHLSQACLGEIKNPKASDSVCLHINIEGKKLVLGTLNSERLPQQLFDLVFDKDFQLSHNWKNGSVFFYGYKADQPTDDYSDDVNSDSDEEKEALELSIPNGGKQGAEKEDKKEEKLMAANKKDTKQKVKIVEPEKNDSDSDEDEDDSMSEDSDEDDEGSDSEEEEEETPKKASEQQSGKKRPNESAIKTPANEKKAKMSTPPKKTDGKKGAAHVHVATPHPSKQNKTPANKPNQESPASASGGAYSCKSCNRNFKSDMALQSHNQAKHK